MDKKNIKLNLKSLNYYEKLSSKINITIYNKNQNVYILVLEIFVI